MTIRLGMSGAYVLRVQQFLTALKLYSGPPDSSFGGGTQAAVKSYQKQHGLPPTGLVDGQTWLLMFPGELEPVFNLVGTSLKDRCLALTGTFETSRYPPESFLGLSGDFDGMGISFGACQWNIGQGTLQPLLHEMFEQHAAVAESIFHESAGTLKALGTAALPDQLAFARSIQTKGQVNEPWKGMLLALGRTPEFQAVQANVADSFYTQALGFCSEFGLTSERAVALMFDIVTQNHSISGLVRASIFADLSCLPTDSDTEVARMVIVANRRAEAASTAYIDDVRTRKLTIANGTGTVHGVFYDLADMFGITLSTYAK